MIFLLQFLFLFLSPIPMLNTVAMSDKIDIRIYEFKSSGEMVNVSAQNDFQ
jgi:hypothetical protein